MVEQNSSDETDLIRQLSCVIRDEITGLETRLKQYVDERTGEDDMAKIKQSVNINGEQHWISGDDIKSLIRSCIAACEKEYSSGRIPDNSILFNDYAVHFFKTYKSDLASLTIKNRDRLFNNHIRPHFDNIKIVDITTDSLQSWINDLNKVYSHETISKIKNIISPVLDSAVEDKIIPSNPFRSPKIVIKGTPTDGHKVIPHEKIKYVRDHIDLLDDRERKLAVLLCYTGMRFEEILGLEYEDFQNEWICIERAVVHPTRNLPEIKLPKTATSKRKIPAPEPVLSVIGTGKGFILHNRSGEPLSYSEARRSFDKIRSRFDLKDYTTHDFRDTCATEWREKGMPLDMIARLLGHSKTEITEKRYVHYDAVLDQTRDIMNGDIS